MPNRISIDLTYGYDLLGRLTSASHSGGSLDFAWDALGRQTGQTGASGTYSSAYDLAGRRTRLTHPDGFFVQQDYLVTGEMVKIRESGATRQDSKMTIAGSGSLSARVTATL